MQKKRSYFFNNPDKKMKNKSKIPYFFNKTKSEFCKDDFKNILPEKFHFSDDLTRKLQNNLYIYDNKINNNSVFYFINTLITSNKELSELHLRIFSEDKADFYAVKSKNKNIDIGIELIFAKTTYENKKTIRYIPQNSEDEELLKTINKTSIDTGTFWIYYKNILQKAKITNVRDKLVEILSELRDDLKKEIKDDKYVQALIDRTLFIKFLEDRHIINSYFYGEDIEYKNVLKSKSPEKINELFAKIQKIFNNYLFKKPEIKIPANILTSSVFEIIQKKIEGVENGQLTLFDFKFDIIPIEAISLIYEIFLEKNQRKDGIYYTPKQLTNLITEKTINKKGKIIDPACGSGAFLISAYKRLLKIEPKQFNSIKEKINYRINLIKENIFGIEKEKTARRLSVFSLYLSILDDLSAKENAELKELLKNESNYPLFIEDIGDNIIHSNTFEKNKFDTEKFDFVVGNPPWKKDFEDEQAKTYYEINKDYFSGKRELSELFLHKAKIWEKENTRYGFVVNTSNFTNEYSKFQDFFYKNFNIENFYEISDLDEIFTASEPAIVCIYTGNKQDNNKLVLNVLKANDFTKLFKSIFILDDDNIEIEQNNLIKSENKENIPLRNFLIGKDGDFTVINYLESNRFDKFENYILKNEKDELFIRQGITIYSKDVLPKVFDVKLEKLSKNDISNLRDEFYQKFTSKIKNKKFCFPYIKTKNISKFIICNQNIELFLPFDISKLRRDGKPENYTGNRILVSRTSDKFKATFVDAQKERIYPTTHINTLKLNNQDHFFYTAILNSKLIEYYLKIKFWQRQKSGFPRINQDPILKIPIPKNRNSKAIKQIEKLSEQFTNEKKEFSKKETEFNELIYDLYGIGLIERQRINDYFIKDGEKVKTDDLKNYSKEFCEYLIDDLKPNVKLIADVYEEKSLVKGISIVKIYFVKKGEEYPKAKKASRYLLTNILKNVSNENILTLRSRIYGENTIYIVKDNLKKNWSLTKAGEDAIAELNKINKHNSKKK